MIQGTPVVPGKAEGSLLVSRRPISLWGSVDPATGRIIDRRHDAHGMSIAGRVFVVGSERGSSTGSAVLLEMLRRNTAPAAILVVRPAPILTLGAIVGEELYGKTVPVIAVPAEDVNRLSNGAGVRIAVSGAIELLASRAEG